MNAFVHCQFCSHEIHESAPACPKCGAPTKKKQKPAGNSPQVYTAYDQVPWFRKRWFLVLCAIIFMPVAVVIAFTGDIYMFQGGEVKPFPKNQKWVLLAVCIGLIAIQLL